jgi:hypothetical protein
LPAAKAEGKPSPAVKHDPGCQVANARLDVPFDCTLADLDLRSEEILGALAFPGAYRLRELSPLLKLLLTSSTVVSRMRSLKKRDVCCTIVFSPPGLLGSLGGQV